MIRSLKNQAILRPPVSSTGIAAALILVNALSYAGNNNALSGHQNPFTEAIEKRTVAKDMPFKNGKTDIDTNDLPSFVYNNKTAIDSKQSKPLLSHQQTIAINALLATGEFVSSTTEPLIYLHDENEQNHYKTGTAAMNQLLKLQIKRWFKTHKDRLYFPSYLTKNKKIELNNPTFEVNRPKDWDYSVKLSGRKIKLQFGKEL